MKNTLAKLCTVKSIVTLILTAVFAYMSIVGRIGPDLYMTIYTVIIAFYFGTQYERKRTTTTNTNTGSASESQEKE